MKFLRKLLLLTLAATTMTACVKDELYHTPHPQRAALVVTTDWSSRSPEAPLPSSYFVCVDTLAMEVLDVTNRFPHLLTEGSHALLVYNQPSGIQIDGLQASVVAVGPGEVEACPGYLYSAARTFQAVADDSVYVEVGMQQRVRCLELQLRPASGEYGRIASVGCTLTGLSPAVGLATGSLDPTPVQAHTPCTVGPDCCTARFHLLGIVPAAQQLLTIDIRFDNGDTQTIVSDITDQLAAFDAERLPLRLTAMLDLPAEPGLAATIGPWQVVPVGNIDAQ
ncbi:MAG: hypothetical protein ACI353_03125 [Alloprevotella sp.]